MQNYYTSLFPWDYCFEVNFRKWRNWFHPEAELVKMSSVSTKLVGPKLSIRPAQDEMQAQILSHGIHQRGPKVVHFYSFVSQNFGDVILAGAKLYRGSFWVNSKLITDQFNALLWWLVCCVICLHVLVVKRGQAERELGRGRSGLGPRRGRKEFYPFSFLFSFLL